MDQALYPNFKCLAGSKVIRYNFCVRMNIRKGREPGNEANNLLQYTICSVINVTCIFFLQNLTQNKKTLLPKFFGLYRYKVSYICIHMIVQVHIFDL